MFPKWLQQFILTSNIKAFRILHTLINTWHYKNLLIAANMKVVEW